MDLIKVGIADDHKIFRKGVILSLRQYTNISFILEADNGEELIQKLSVELPDVVLIDLRMPTKDGIEATKEISKKYPDVKILIVTMYEDERFVSHLMENGANGYLLKNSEPAEIKKAIVEVMVRGYYLNNFVNRVLLKKSIARNKTIPSLNGENVVSEKEKEVIQLLCREYTAAEIAAKMEISARTVESIKDRLMERFGIKNTAGLVFFAVKNNLTD
jgi:DNA-binding NarL/FixJ family response regulator